MMRCYHIVSKMFMSLTPFGKRFVEKNYSEESIELEHRLAEIIYQQECNGFKFNTTKAQRLYSELAAKKESLKQELKDSFPDWEVRTPFIQKVNNKKLGYRKEIIPNEKVQVIETIKLKRSCCKQINKS